MKIVGTTPTLWKAFGALTDAARCYAPQGPPMNQLMRAAVTFTTQLAIEGTAHDPAEARAIESEVLSRLASQPNFLTHDGACVIEALARAAHLYTLLPPFPPKDLLKHVTETLPRKLSIAAVAFTLQLAMDGAGRNPLAMRTLERALISKLEEPWELGTFPPSVKAALGESWGSLPKLD